MACSCHGKDGISTNKTDPNDQCTACAKKHIVKAWNLFNEFTYEDDNRDVISGQLRNAADHIKNINKQLALKIRDLAIIIEQARDKEITTQWDNILTQIREIFYAEHPQVKERLQELKNNK